jgi:SAM-dependent methyltransferase
MNDTRPNRPGDPARSAATAALSAVDYDTELQQHNEILRPACGVQPDDHVLDIGCGTGQTTRQAARSAVSGGALGVDLSASAVARARRLAREDGLRNIVFERADAQTRRFPAHRFDLAISRFGTMFFSDPVTAFANIGRALRPAGRLVMMVWQAKQRNDWAVALDEALAVPDGLAAIDHAFSLADPPTVTAMLREAGFTDVTFTDVRRPVYYGPDTDTALAWVHGFARTSQALQRLNPPAAERALNRLRETLAEHANTDGVWFDSSAWIVTARRPTAGPPQARRDGQAAPARSCGRQQQLLISSGGEI